MWYLRVVGVVSQSGGCGISEWWVWHTEQPLHGLSCADVCLLTLAVSLDRLDQTECGEVRVDTITLHVHLITDIHTYRL